MLKLNTMSRRIAALVGALVVVVVAGCSNPTSPEGQPATDSILALSLSSTSVSLARGGAASVTATATFDGSSPIDVSALATWTSSNPSVVTVMAGQLIAVGLGQARIDVSYKGATSSLDVVSRRNTVLKGTIVVNEVDGKRMLDSTELRIGGKPVGMGSSTSDHIGSRRVSISVGFGTMAFAENAILPPGNYELSVVFLQLWGGPARVAVDGAASELVIWDKDTNERLESIQVSSTNVTVIASTPMEGMRIPFTIPAFTK